MTAAVPVSLGAGHPVLDTVLPVIDASHDVRTNAARAAEVARWMAYEELRPPPYLLPFPWERGREALVDFVLVANAINFAFTDFESGERFEVDYLGRRFSDSDALLACLHRALADGIDVLDGALLRDLEDAELAHILHGRSELPLLGERAEILRGVGVTLVERYDNRFHNLLAAAAPRLYDGGRGFLELLVQEFPRFDDVSEYDGRPVRFWKLAQLTAWMLHASLGGHGGFDPPDLDRLTAFADYIVPAALRILGVLEYSGPLERAIVERRPIERDSPWEVELRAHTVYASALLCDRINELRPPELRVIVPQVDARLWVPYHTTFWPHHLTRTIMY